jgi:hypothetical protein
MTALVAQRGAIGLGQEASALPASGERFAANAIVGSAAVRPGPSAMRGSRGVVTAGCIRRRRPGFSWLPAADVIGFERVGVFLCA